VWRLEEQGFKEVRPTRLDMLRLMFPGRGYAVELYFDTGNGPPNAIFTGEGRFRGWKVNVEAPFSRTSVGFDTIDNTLDIFVRPDRSWYWTDEDELAFWVDNGGYTPEESDGFYRDTSEAEQLVKAGQPPFDDQWVDWRPPPGLALPSLPQGWQFVPGAEITAGINRRYDAWRPGRDVASVIEAWYRLLDAHHRDPESRRSRGS
jgi:hypothetical protein